ncbi:MAG TPA: 2'-deoxycytidine 5'-triphosphate deaminase [Bryobacteraceae bacterium]|nr:2'-deoxycytidine 5'-triphosphate deaminase [Bryobacteraceae bacterium]
MSSDHSGVLPSQALEQMIANGAIRASAAILPEQIQPSSLDLRLGAEAYRVRASFLAAGSATVSSKLEQYRLHTLDLTKPAVLEKGCVYIVPLQEELALPPNISGKANPKSSTGRLDIFTRLITDEGRQFEIVPAGYKGRLFAEVVPRTFSIVARQGDRLSQLRLFQGEHQPSDMLLREIDSAETLVYLPDETPGAANIANGLRLSVDLAGIDGSPVIGYRAKKHAPLIDLSCIGHYPTEDFWDPIRRNDSRTLVLDPEDFYILASRERVRIPPLYAAEMVPYDPTVGEFRIHYAGFFDPGFGYGSAAGEITGTRAVLEVRSHEVPFILEDGQVVASLVFERLLERPRALYGEGIGSNYQRQGLKLSKHFKTPVHA